MQKKKREEKLTMTNFESVDVVREIELYFKEKYSLVKQGNITFLEYIINKLF